MKARNGLGAALVATFSACLLAGCSVSMPIGSLMPERHPEDATGTISNERIAGFLDGEDWHHAKVALIAALDPQGSGEIVHWVNPASGTKGFFVADGKPYPSEAGICRGFLADIDRKSADNSLHGVACTDKAGEWTVTEYKQGKKG